MVIPIKVVGDYSRAAKQKCDPPRATLRRTQFRWRFHLVTEAVCVPLCACVNLTQKLKIVMTEIGLKYVKWYFYCNNNAT